MTKKIVLIEDDADLFALLKYNLEKGRLSSHRDRRPGAAPSTFAGGFAPTWFCSISCCPISDGLDICKGIRNDPELAQTPIIFLTARASETDRIVGLELGANDYIVKPFFIRELIARIKLQFRTQAAPSRLLKAGGVELDRSSCQVKLGGENLSLTATEFRLLEFLMSRPSVVFSREQLLNAVWGQDRAITDRTVDVYILRLRQKIEKDASAPRLPIYIPVRGFGYSFEPRNQEAALGAAVCSGAALLRAALRLFPTLAVKPASLCYAYRRGHRPDRD